MIEREHCLYVEIKLLETFLGYFHFFYVCWCVASSLCLQCRTDGVWVVSVALMTFTAGSNIISFVCKHGQLPKKVTAISLFEMDVGPFTFQLHVMSNRLTLYY